MIQAETRTTSRSGVKRLKRKQGADDRSTEEGKISIFLL